MAIHSAAASAVARSGTVSEPSREKFTQLFGEGSPRQVAPPNVSASTPKPGVGRAMAAGAPAKVHPPRELRAARPVDGVPKAGKVIDAVNLAQARLDQILKVAQSGKSFTPAELLALQAQVSQASQQLDLAGKVVEKATSGVKQVLQTQV